MTTLQHSYRTFVVRNLMVILAGIGIALSLFVGILRPFDVLSFFLAIPMGLASVIIFGWACYLGYRH